MSEDTGASLRDRATRATPGAAKASPPSGECPSRNPHLLALEISARDAVVEDVSHIVRIAPFLARYPVRLFTPGLVAELAEAVDILSCKVADLKEVEGAGR